MSETIRIICGHAGETSQRDVYPVTEIARRFRISRRHVWRLAKAKGFTVETVCNVACIDAATVEALAVERAAS